MSLSDWVVSWVRTQVAIWIPTAATALTGIGIALPVDAGTVVAGSLSISAYYTAVRLLEAKWPAVGVLLGWKKQPTYTESPPLRSLHG